MIERPDAPAGHPGIGGSHHFALAVADRDILLMWKRRFLDEGYPVNGILDRHYFQSIYIKDPDGQIVELATLGPGWTIDEEAARIGEEHRAPAAGDDQHQSRPRAHHGRELARAVRDISPGCGSAACTM